MKIQAIVRVIFSANCTDRTKHVENTDSSHPLVWGTSSFTQH